MTARTVVTSELMRDPMYRLVLPDDWTGVIWHWPSGDFAECREHIEASDTFVGSPVEGTLARWGFYCDHGHEVP